MSTNSLPFSAKPGILSQYLIDNRTDFFKVAVSALSTSLLAVRGYIYYTFALCTFGLTNIFGLTAIGLFAGFDILVTIYSTYVFMEKT
jgi:hypothetical protein